MKSWVEILFVIGFLSLLANMVFFIKWPTMEEIVDCRLERASCERLLFISDSMLQEFANEGWTEDSLRLLRGESPIVRDTLPLKEGWVAP